MATTASAAALLHVALQDIHAGKVDQAKRLVAIASRCGDDRLRDLLRAEAGRTGAQAERIAAAGVEVTGPANLWMGGILDDAERDTRETQPGRLLDIALVGAIRKAKAAEIVSTETAIALAQALDDAALLAVATANRGEEIETDRQLKDRLADLAAG